MTLTLDSAEQLRQQFSDSAGQLLSLFPDGAQLELSSDAGPFRVFLFPDGSWLFPDERWLALSSDPSVSHFHDAQIVHGLDPQPEPDEPGKVLGKTACHWCGRHDPPGGLTKIAYRPVTTTEHTDPKTLESTTEHHPPGPPVHDPAGAHCADGASCMAHHLASEPSWADHQMPEWRQRYQKYLDAERKRLEASKQTAYAWYHPAEIARQQAQLEAEDRQLHALAAEFRPPDSFFSELAVLLAARRGEAVELAAEGEGIFAAPDTTGPAPFAMLPGCGGPDGCTHDTLRCGWARQHTLGHMRGKDSRVTDAAAAMGRRSVT